MLDWSCLITLSIIWFILWPGLITPGIAVAFREVSPVIFGLAPLTFGF